MAATLQVAKSDPQTYSLGNGCSSVGATNVSDFFNNLNATFSDLRSQLSHDKWFATAQSSISSEPVFGMAQCRNYMSQLDCLACYDAAVSDIRNTCASKNVTGARSVFDGCFLRYYSSRVLSSSSVNHIYIFTEKRTFGIEVRELQILRKDKRELAEMRRRIGI